MRLKFRAISGSLKGLEWETDKETVTVGRSPENDLVLKEASVSRLHATILARDGAIFVEDSGSSNRTQVDGKVVKDSAAVGDGSILLFGDVALQVRCPDLVVSPKEDALQAPAPAVPEQWLSRPRETLLPVLAGRGELLERGIWPVLTLLLGVLAAAILVLFFLRRSGGMDAPKGEYGVSVRVGERKVVQVPKGFVRDPVVEFPGTVSVERPLNLDVAVQIDGLKQGLTTVTLHGEDGEFLLLHVNVLPLERKEAEGVLSDQVRSEDERASLATKSMKRGEVLEEQRALYEAMEEYGRALALLAPFEQNPNRLYMEALERYDRTSREIQDLYDELTQDMGDNIRIGNKRVALERLAEIMELIPDETDVRRQNADLLFRLLEKAIGAEERRAGRGL